MQKKCRTGNRMVTLSLLIVASGTVDVLSDISIRMEMPCFLESTEQHTTEQSNSSRLITKEIILIDSKHKHVKVILSKSIIEFYVLYFRLSKYCFKLSKISIL